MLSANKASGNGRLASTWLPEFKLEALALLEKGRDYLHAHPAVAECPLCGSDEKIRGLADSIERRLKNLASLKAADTTKKKQQSVA
jgi:hypothetical protein